MLSEKSLIILINCLKCLDKSFELTMTDLWRDWLQPQKPFCKSFEISLSIGP